MKKIIVFGSLIAIFLCRSQTVSVGTLKNEDISKLCKNESEKIFEKIVKIRRVFHKNPELAGKEINTQNTIKQYLSELGLQVKTNVYGNSVVGILKGGKKGKKIAWRADMDALPNDFPDAVEFKSNTKGILHGCGHDVHMAIALGIAEVLSKHKKDLNGTLYFIFQPEEETFIGAKKMIENGLFSKIKPDEIYGLHVTALPSGQIMVKKNELFAYQKGIRIQLKNTLSKEETNQLAGKLRNALVRTQNGSKPWEIQNIIDSKIGLYNQNTIFKDYCISGGDFIGYSKNDSLFLEAELYETDANQLKNIIPTIKRTIETEGYASQLVEVLMIKENPTVMNDSKLTNIAINTFEKMYGKEFIAIDYGQVPFFNDDFAYYQQKIPGVYFLFGGSNFEKGIIAMNHAPNFMVDENCIKTGVEHFSYFLFNRLSSK